MTVVRPGAKTEVVAVPEEHREQPAAEVKTELHIGSGTPVGGPVRESSETRTLRAAAAVKAARAALGRLGRDLERLDPTDRRQLESLRSAMLRSADALQIALALPEVREDAKSQQALSLSLGTILGPLERALDRIGEQGLPAKKLAELEAARGKLIAPSAGLASSAGQFVAISDAIEIAKSAHEKLQATLAKLEVKGKKLSKEAEAALFRAILASDRFGLVMSIDAGVFDFLPEHLSKAITRDHHAIHFDPRNPEVNSTMRLLEDVEKVSALPLPLEEKIARLQHDYRYAVTNNLGDAILPLVLARRIPELVEHGGIRIAMKKGSTVLIGIEHLKRLAHFEDFGFFGSGNVLEGRKRSAPGEVVLRDLIHVVLANYQSFDELLAEYEIPGSDRFDGLPASKQRELVDDAITKVEQNLDHYDIRLERAEAFKAGVEDLKGQVGASQREMRKYLEEHGVPKADLDTLEGRIFYFFDTNKGGRFATWDAPSLVHKNKIQWNAIRFDTPNGTKWGFALAVPSGRDPDFLDTTMVQAFGPHFPKAIPRGETLLFVFKPEDGVVPPEEMAKILAAEIRRHEVPVKPERRQPPALVTPKENVISNDAYMYDDRGDYLWTPERFEQAKQFSREAYEAALQGGSFDRVLLVMGLPSSGKSTYLREHQDPRTLFVDDTLTTPEKRSWLIEKAKEQGVPVDVVWIDTPFEVCCERMETRPDRDIPREWMEARNAELRASPPSPAEGLRRVDVIRS